MEVYVKIFVQATVLFYVLFKLWLFLFKHRAYGIWNMVTPKHKGVSLDKAEPSPAPTETIVGRSYTTYLDKPADPSVPIMSQAMEPSGFIEEESEIDSGQVADTISRDSGTPILSDDDVFVPLDATGRYDGGEFSTGMTFDQLINAAQAITEADISQERKTEAAATLYDIKNTHLFDMIASEVTNIESIKKLWDEYLDSEGSPLKDNQKLRIEGFDMDKFI